MPAKNKRPFLQNILTSLEPGEGRLIASRCADCGRVGFPARPICIFCQGRNTERINLSRRGRLHTFTICRMPVQHIEPPYAIGYVDMPEGVRVFALLSDWEEKDLEVGMEMEMEVTTLYEEDGKEVIAYKFHPLKSG
jgi:uncharacterized OB-fold protein